MAYFVEVSASASLGNVVPVQVYVRIDASVYDVSKTYVSNHSVKYKYVSMCKYSFG